LNRLRPSREWALTVLVLGAFLLTGAVDSAADSDRPDILKQLETFVSRDKVHAGETFQAAVRLEIGPGWHINGNPASDEFLVPTTLEIKDLDGPFRVRDVVYPEAVSSRFAFSENEVAVYSGRVIIGMTLEANADLAPGNYRLKGTVTWQACNDISCLPPETRNFEFEISVAEAGRRTKAVNAEIFERKSR
jgi:DsbC/DsbD-like thiol-disulfide interchange protein